MDRRRADDQDSPLVRLGGQPGNRGIQLVEYRYRGTNRVGVGSDEQVHVGGALRHDGRDDLVERRPQFRACAEGAHHEHRVQPGHKRGVASVVGPGHLPDRADQPAVDGVDVTIGVEKQVGRCHGGMQRPVEVRHRLACVGEQLPDPGQLTGHGRADTRRLGEPQAPVTVSRAELGGAKQRGRRVSGVTAAQHFPRDPRQQPGHILIRAKGRAGQMPRPPLGLIAKLGGQRPVSPAQVLTDGQFDHRRPDQRMAEGSCPVLPMYTRPACSAAARASISR